MSVELTPVVVLDLNFAGYGIVRSLSPYGIPVIGFYTRKNLPESRTRLCVKKIHYEGDFELLEKLLQLLDWLNKKPILILSTDDNVRFFLKNRQFIEQNFLIQLPSNDIVELLLDKVRFARYATKNNIFIPRCSLLYKEEHLDSIAGRMDFPLVLKPHNRTPNWRNAGFPKAYHLFHMDDLRRVYMEVGKIEPRLMLQEWIPGNDSNLQYCLTYYAEESECLAAFTGYKIRQWPVGTGTTTTTAPVDNPYILEKTSEIFSNLGYQGFGSIEFKRHEINGKYYLIEPTVGRPDQQEYVATINGVNLPLRSYNFITGAGIEEKTPPGKTILYIEEHYEVPSALVHLKRRIISPGAYIKSLRGAIIFRYANRKDPMVFLGLLLKVVASIFNNKQPSKLKTTDV